MCENSYRIELIHKIFICLRVVRMYMYHQITTSAIFLMLREVVIDIIIVALI